MSVNIIRRPRAEDGFLSCVTHPKLRQIYATRGITQAAQLDTAAKALLHYGQLRGIASAVTILAEAIRQKEKILVIGDFDADGATSTALCMLALSMFGSKDHDFLVPNRFDFGYGLSPQIVDVAHQRGAKVIMTVDNGIACLAGVQRAKSLGIKVLVTDHHLAAERLPCADAIVNPNQPGCDFLSKNLAGVGVAFYLMLALRAHLRKQNWFIQQGLKVPNLAELLDIVALGTVADVVPLDHNNRVLVHQGLQRIRSGKCRPGITAMIEVAGRSASRLTATDLGFVLGPRLNAAGRLDDMSLGIECLLSQQPGEARGIAVKLDALNQERREIERSMQADAMRALDALDLSTDMSLGGIVLYQDDYHQGVIGILAGRIKDKYHRPTIAFAHQDDGNLKGSARSIAGLHIRDLLEDINSRYPDLIDKFGGHAMAAGLSIKRHKLAVFKQAFEQLATDWMASLPLQGELLTDGELAGADLTLDFAVLLKDAGPWGQGFTEPMFDGRFELIEQRLVGGNHLKVLLKHPDDTLLDGIAFNIDKQIWPNQAVKNVHLAYKLDINEFRGRVSLQLLIEGIVPA